MHSHKKYAVVAFLHDEMFFEHVVVFFVLRLLYKIRQTYESHLSSRFLLC